MQLGAVGGSSFAALQQGTGPPAVVKQAFQDLETAVGSGNLDDAKKALANLAAATDGRVTAPAAPKPAPTGASGPPKNDLRANPMSDRMDALKKAVDSGDVKAAQTAWADLKQGLAQGPLEGGLQLRLPNLTVNAPVQHASSATSGSSTSATSTSTGTTIVTPGSSASTQSLQSFMYAKADANQDGLVSATERLTYDMKHPAASSNYLAPGSLLDTTG